MASLETLAAFFGWCTVLNIAFMLLTMVLVVSFRESASTLHSKLFNLPKDEIYRTYYWYLAAYKLAVLVFNLVPYIALRIML